MNSLNKPKLLSRIFARFLDYCFFYSLFVLPLFFATIIENDFLHLISMALVPLFWIPLEALFISLFKSTPGKALLGIKVTDLNGNHLGYLKSLKRSFCFWTKGLCCNIVPFNLFCAIRQINFIKKHETTSFDKALNIKVTVKLKRKLRIIASSVLVFLYSLFFVAEFEFREVLLTSDQEFFSTKIFKKEQWITFKDPEGAYEIGFPSNPKKNDSMLPTPKGTDPMPFREIKHATKERIEYNLSHTNLPKSITKWSSGLVLKGSLKLLASHTPGGAKIHKKSSKSFKRYPALEFILLKKGNLKSAGRLILVGSTLYKIEVTYPAEKDEEIQEDLNTFLQSFNIK